MRSVITEFLQVEMGIAVEHGSAHATDLVLVMVTRQDHRQAIGFARASSGGAPVVAVLPSGDAWLAERSIAAGAHAIQRLDQSFAEMRESLVALLCPPADAAGG